MTAGRRRRRRLPGLKRHARHIDIIIFYVIDVDVVQRIQRRKVMIGTSGKSFAASPGIFHITITFILVKVEGAATLLRTRTSSSTASPGIFVKVRMPFARGRGRRRTIGGDDHVHIRFFFESIIERMRWGEHPRSLFVLSLPMMLQEDL